MTTNLIDPAEVAAFNREMERRLQKFGRRLARAIAPAVHAMHRAALAAPNHPDLRPLQPAARACPRCNRHQFSKPPRLPINGHEYRRRTRTRDRR